MHRRARHLNAATAGATLVLDSRYFTGLSDGGAVASWVDRSGFGDTFTQSTAGRRPTYKTGILGGQPVVRFDGGDDLQKAAPTTRFRSNPTTIMFLYTRPSGTTEQCLMDVGNNRAITIASNVIYYRNGGNVSTSPSPVGTHIISIPDNGTAPFVCMDGISYTVANPSFTPGSDVGVGIGATAGSPALQFVGDTALMNFFNVVLANPLRRRLEHAACYSFKIPCS